MRHADRPVNKPDNLGAGRGLPVRIEHTVNAEIAVMLPLAVVPSVGIGSVRMENRMVHHFPDTAAHQIIIVIDFLPVCFGIAGTHTHGVGIFTEEIRPVVEALLFSAVLADPVHLLHRWVHLAAYIIRLPFAVDSALVMHGKR